MKDISVFIITQNIQQCLNSSTIQKNNRKTRQNRYPNTQIHERSLSWFGTVWSKLALWTQPPLLLMKRCGHATVSHI